VIAAVGRPKDAAVKALVSEYESRAARYWPLESVEVREESARGLTPESVKVREGERLLERLRGMRLVACDRDGERYTSEEFSRWLESIRERGGGQDVAFVIGGAFGLGAAVLAQASSRLSLAPWTLQHELARIVLAEQIYRAGTIVRREPYHK
jgi:23S rRNA (pseudouridine1915-N3)-methyltransferase